MRIGDHEYLCTLEPVLRRAAFKAGMNKEEVATLRLAVNNCYARYVDEVEDMLEDPRQLVKQYLRWKEGPFKAPTIEDTGDPGLYGSFQNLDVDIDKVFNLAAKQLMAAGRPGLRVYIQRLPPPMPGRTTETVGDYNRHRNAIRLNETSVEYVVKEEKGGNIGQQPPEDKAEVAVAIIHTMAHEVTHSAVERLRKVLSPTEFDNFMERAVVTNLEFRKRVLSSFNKVLSPFDKGGVDYLAGDPKDINYSYSDVTPELMAGEFIAEMGALILINRLEFNEVPDNLKGICAAVTERTHKGIRQLKELFEREDPEQMKCLYEIMEALTWALAPDFDGQHKPRWLSEDATMRLPTDEELKQDPKLMGLLRFMNESKFETTPAAEELGAYPRYFGWHTDEDGKLVDLFLTPAGGALAARLAKMENKQDTAEISEEGSAVTWSPGDSPGLD